MFNFNNRYMWLKKIKVWLTKNCILKIIHTSIVYYIIYFVLGIKAIHNLYYNMAQYTGNVYNY